jgi:TET-Associated Glycosyltransferase
MPNPRFPVYILSKGRADCARTMPALDQIGVPYRVIVEAQERDAYAARFGADRVLVLDPAYQRPDAYDQCDRLGDAAPPGCAPARNFILDHAIAEGHDWHWMLDDNIRVFYRLHNNQKIPCGDGTPFRAMEDFVLRYRNVALAGPNYGFSIPARGRFPPYWVGTRVYSCQLVRCDVPFRWRGRMNEDTITCLDVLKAGWNTVLFTAFLQGKRPTGNQAAGSQTIDDTARMPGGMTELYQTLGPRAKAEMLYRAHPDVTRIVWRFGRWHHYVNYDQWRNRPLVRRDDEVPDAPAEPYRFRRIPRQSDHARSEADLLAMRRRNRSIREQPCPTCGAASGQYCRTSSGRSMSFHSARIRVSDAEAV